MTSSVETWRCGMHHQPFNVIDRTPALAFMTQNLNILLRLYDLETHEVYFPPN